MQKMDIVCLNSLSHGREFRLLELKDKESTPDELEQLRRYIWWIRDYVLEEKDKVQPVWVSRGFQKLNEAKKKAKKIADEEKCEEPQIWQWKLEGNHPRFERL